jgi:hypothetical protein
MVNQPKQKKIASQKSIVGETEPRIQGRRQNAGVSFSLGGRIRFARIIIGSLTVLSLPALDSGCPPDSARKMYSQFGVVLHGMFIEADRRHVV